MFVQYGLEPVLAGPCRLEDNYASAKAGPRDAGAGRPMRQKIEHQPVNFRRGHVEIIAQRDVRGGHQTSERFSLSSLKGPDGFNRALVLAGHVPGNGLVLRAKRGQVGGITQPFQLQLGSSFQAGRPPCLVAPVGQLALHTGVQDCEPPPGRQVNRLEGQGAGIQRQGFSRVAWKL